MDWMQLKVTCSTDDLDRVSAVMSMLDNSLMIEDYRDMEDGLNAIYGELIDEELKKVDRTVASVSIFIPETKNYHDYEMFIRERMNTLGIKYDMTFTGVNEEDWANAWKQYYKPIKTGPRLVIVPAWEDYAPAEGEVTLTMDPGMAFGTGTHETTRLCASLIEEHMPQGARVLDIGTGSGILAIAASKLGAGEVYACDIDPTAVKVARENVASNNVSNVRCEVADLLAGKELGIGLYDFACANIVADVIIRLADQVGKYLKFGGTIVTSGIIDEHGDEVVAAMDKNGFALADALGENGWKAFAFKKIR
ncbi:MAG: 50S ribosomal protein L11 methyltransferase [Eubacteriales bacterium]